MFPSWASTIVAVQHSPRSLQAETAYYHHRCFKVWQERAARRVALLALGQGYRTTRICAPESFQTFNCRWVLVTKIFYFFYNFDRTLQLRRQCVPKLSEKVPTKIHHPVRTFGSSFFTLTSERKSGLLSVSIFSIFAFNSEFPHETNSL